MKRSILALTLLAAGGAAAGATVSERWGGAGTTCTHAGAMKVVQAGQVTRLVFDLSAIPAGAKVHRAALYCFTSGNRQPTDPAQIFVTDRLGAEGAPVPGREPLKLIPPWYRSLDATAAVRRWAGEPAKNLGLAVTRFERFDARRTYLEVTYDGKPANLPEQVTGVKAVHHDGQTFIVWKEHSSYRPEADKVIWFSKAKTQGDELAKGPGQGAFGMPNHPGITLRTLRHLQGLGLRDKPSGFQGIKSLKRIRRVEPVTYRVYRHTERITAGNIHAAQRIGEVGPLNGYDDEVYDIHYKGEYIDQWEDPDSFIRTYCTDKGKALMPGEGLYVQDATKAGGFHYAVTAALAGTENLAEVSDANSLARPVAEKPQVPKPVLQWIEEPHYRKGTVDAYWYRYWGAPPYVNVPGRSFRVGVGVPRKYDEPIALSIGSISGAFNVRGALRIPSPKAITLVIQRQLSWMPALFYNQGKDTLRAINECKVDYYSERYMAFMIHWVMSNYKIDRSKITGSLMHFGLRHPEIFTRMQMGTYTAGYDLRWAPGGPSMPRVLGPMGIKTTTGEDAWKMYSVSEYVNTYPDRDIPFLICISATGKDGGHTCEFGWQDDPRGWAGLLKARQTFVAAWSLGIPSELGRAFRQMRWDVSIPAFSNCSLDNNPGNGDAAEGDFYGQINGWLLWSDTDQADRKDKWQMTVWVVSSCPDDACTVDITPRHCKNFKPRKGQKFKWTNTSLADNKPVGSGTVTADQWGLVTVKGVKVGKGKNRITISKP